MIAQGIGAIVAGVQSLAALGVADILVANAPNLGRLPGVVGTLFEPAATGASLAFNVGLEAQLAALPDAIRVEVLDLFGIGKAIAANPATLGITITDAACITPVSFCGPDATGSAYYDDIHPTMTIHTVWAAAEALTPSPAPVPLPAAGALLAAGLLSLGLFRRRSAQI